MLAIDVGNTHITNALFHGGEIRRIEHIPTARCVEDGAFFGLLSLLDGSIPGEIVISSVRKDITRIIERECAKQFHITPFFVDVHVEMGIVNLYKTKETLGTDRVVNASAAYHLYSKGTRPLIVADLGTATTIDYITESGEYIGGAIVPGIISAYHGLITVAPELPLVNISPVQKVVGETTEEGMRSGIVTSHGAMVKEMAAMMAREKGTEPAVVVTGGLSAVVKDILPQSWIVDEHLTLKGLSIIYDINKVQDS